MVEKDITTVVKATQNSAQVTECSRKAAGGDCRTDLSSGHG
jgi:hypothetical protein